MKVERIYRRPDGLIKIRAVLFSDSIETVVRVEILKASRSGEFKPLLRDRNLLTKNERAQATKEAIKSYLKPHEIEAIKNELINKLKSVINEI